MRTFAGITVLISGSARGQGAEIAVAFHTAGASVVISDVLDDEGLQLRDRLGEDRAMYAHLDVTDASQWRAVVDEATGRFGPVTVLVNNAELAGDALGDVRDLDPAQFDQIMAVNVLGALHGMQAIAPGMRSAGGGSIVNISSMVAVNGQAKAAAYTASQWALRGLSKCAAVDLAGDGIRVNAILPGLIADSMDLESGISAEELFARSESHLLIKRLGRPDDITPMVLFLASVDAGYITGTDVVIDGGWTAS
jgi:3alpha(or 20beta)-hydroxysteroid dehydrogenase